MKFFKHKIASARYIFLRQTYLQMGKRVDRLLDGRLFHYFPRVLKMKPKNSENASSCITPHDNIKKKDEHPTQLRTD